MQDTSQYRTLTPVQHVKLRKSMYVGDCSVRHHATCSYIWDAEENRTKESCLTTRCDGLEKLLYEAIDNATDNAHRTPPTTDIRVSMTKDTFTCSNNGVHIPIQTNVCDGTYIPSTIFFKMHSGSNFQDEVEARTAAGMNGLGIKLAAILSRSFTVTCYDPVSKLCFVQCAIDGLDTVHKPVVTKLHARRPKHITTSVTFVPDLTAHFPDLLSLDTLQPRVLTRLVQLSATMGGKVTFWFNGHKIKLRSFKEYVRSFPCRPHPVHYRQSETVEYAVACSPSGEHTHISFVNNLFTEEGGTHVRSLVTQVIAVVYAHFDKKLSKDTVRPTRVQIRNNLTLFCSVTVENPEFQSQSKRCLTRPVAFGGISTSELLSAAKRCGLLERVATIVARKETSLLNDALSSKNKKKSIHVENLTDARFAGTPKSKDCSLFVVEGLSAKTFAVSGLAEVGNVHYGIYPVRGKPLNVFNSSQKAIVQNKEIGELCKILGLRTNTDYSTEKALSTLRYRYMVVLTDADVDGFHICGLLIAFLYKLFPSLLKRGFVKRFVTPVIVARRHQQQKEFFTVSDYNTWAKALSPTQKWHIKYFKGLGSSTKEQARAYFRNMQRYLKPMEHDVCTDDRVQLLFDSKNADRRKAWMLNTPRTTLDYEASRMTISRFVDTEMHDFSMETITRAIPGLDDGLKESQRKVLFAVIQKASKNNNQEIKIAQLGAYAAEITAYLHGEKSIQDTCNKMTHSFVGSNNLHVLEACGNTGSRLQLGADAASTRYTFTRLMPYTRHIFNTLDDTILARRTEEGMQIEYVTFAPILPMLLINGSMGIATGFRTTIPCHNPTTLVGHLKDRLRQIITKFPALTPYYRGWKGTVTETDTDWAFHGTCRRNGTRCTITELPVLIATERYKTKVLLPLLEKKHIRDMVEEHPDENGVCFTFVTTETFRESMLGLVSHMTKGCLNVLVDGSVCHFRDTSALLEVFYKRRLRMYTNRRENMLVRFQAQLRKLTAKCTFVQLVLDGKVTFRNVTKVEIVQCLVTDYKIPRDFCDDFLHMPMISLTKERVDELLRQIQTVRASLVNTEKATPSSLWLLDLEKLVTLITTPKKRKRPDIHVVA